LNPGDDYEKNNNNLNEIVSVIKKLNSNQMVNEQIKFSFVCDKCQNEIKEIDLPNDHVSKEITLNNLDVN